MGRVMRCQFCTIYNYNTTVKFIRNPYYPQVVIKLKKYSNNLIKFWTKFWTKSAILDKQNVRFWTACFLGPCSRSLRKRIFVQFYRYMLIYYHLLTALYQ